MRRIMYLFLLCFALVRANAAESQEQKFVVFFEDWSAKLDDAALAVIGQAADRTKAHSGVVAHVDGFADPSGSRTANALLTQLRAQVVMDQLQTDGVPAARLRGIGRGSVHFALSSQESRRVEISLNGH
jgi:outer membrane protein OmpA-like peptidoglycan-associated protein